MMTGCKSTLSRKAGGRAKADTKSRQEIARPARATRAIQTSTRERTVAELDIGRKTAGDQVEEPATIPPVTTATRREATTTRKAKAKTNTWTLWKRISPLKQLQPCRILDHTPSTIGELSCNSKRGTVDHGCDNQFRVYKETKLVQSICLTVVHSFTPVQSSIQDKKYRCLILESTLQVELDSNMTEDDW